MRRIPKPRDPVLFFCVAIALASIVASAVYFTRSQDIRDGFPERTAVNAEIVMQYAEPGAEGKSVWHGLYTSSPEQIRELTALVQKYPYNRKPDLSWIGVGKFYTQPTTTMWVTLSCPPENGKNIWAQELVYSDGSMYAALSDGHLFPCGAGRFGTSRTREYGARLQDFFREKEKSPDWKTARDAQK